MSKFVAYEKLSKKEKRKIDLQRRTTWSVNPVTRRSVNPKTYNRKKTQVKDYYPDAASSLFFINLLSEPLASS